MNIINDNTFNLHNSLLNNDNRYMKVIIVYWILLLVTWNQITESNKVYVNRSCQVANFGYHEF